MTIQGGTNTVLSGRRNDSFDKRGINVYPALLPSMQRLTRRGVELAARASEKRVFP